MLVVVFLLSFPAGAQGVVRGEKQVQREHADRCLSDKSVFFSP